MFETKDILTIILALYGAILSSILAIREAKKEKRSIELFLDYYELERHYKLVIVNIGYRPATILSCGIRELYQNGLPVDQRPLNLTYEEQNSFPLTLKDGEHETIVISHSFDDPRELKIKRQKLEAYVRDAEGNISKTSTIRTYSSRIDRYST